MRLCLLLLLLLCLLRAFVWKSMQHQVGGHSSCRARCAVETRHAVGCGVVSTRCSKELLAYQTLLDPG